MITAPSLDNPLYVSTEGSQNITTILFGEHELKIFDLFCVLPITCKTKTTITDQCSFPIIIQALMIRRSAYSAS